MDGAASDSRELRSMLETLVRAAVPELLQLSAPLRARVVRVHETAGTEEDSNPRYCCDLQPLGPDDSDDQQWPELPRVDLPVLWAGPDVGIYCPPAVNTVVRVAFEYGDRSRPFVVGLVGVGASVPAHPVGTLLVRAGDAVVRVRRDQSGAVEVEAHSVLVKGASKVVVNSPVVHLGGESGSPVVRESDLLAALNALTLPVSGVVAGPPVPPLAVLPSVSQKVRSE